MPKTTFSVNELLTRRKQKQLVKEASSLFNSKPEEGIAFLIANGLFEKEDFQNIAVWLRLNPCLDKRKIAEYLCRSTSLILFYALSFSFHHFQA